MKLKIKCTGSHTMHIDGLHEFQGDFKTLTPENYKKLRHVLETEGFCDPINVWYDPDLEKHFILDGHQRKHTLSLMRKDGWEIPELPINLIEAESKLEAKKLVLTFSSNYGEISKDSLTQFMTDSGIDFDFLKDSIVLPMIDMNLEALQPKPPIEGEFDLSKEIDEYNDYIVLVFSTKSDFEKGMQHFKLKRVNFKLSANTEPGSPWDRFGIGRIVSGNEYLESLGEKDV